MLLELQSGNFVSGEELAEKYEVSRASISHWMESLTSYGLDVSKVRGKGYRLNPCPVLIDRTRLVEGLKIAGSDRFNVIDVTLESASTNSEALTGLYSDESWNVYVAEYQSSGRGRRGKQWISPLGNSLLFSLAKRSEWSLPTIYLSSLVVGMSISTLLHEMLPNHSVQLKWPNDIYVDGRKLAGILCELQGSPSSESLLVVGVGLNILTSPNDTEVPTTNLLELMRKSPDRTEILRTICLRIMSEIANLEQTGPTKSLDRWHEFDYLFGKEVVIRQGANTYNGMANGIDEQGQLIVVLSTGETKMFNGGEVSVRPNQNVD